MVQNPRGHARRFRATTRILLLRPRLQQTFSGHTRTHKRMKGSNHPMSRTQADARVGYLERAPNSVSSIYSCEIFSARRSGDACLPELSNARHGKLSWSRLKTAPTKRASRGVTDTFINETASAIFLGSKTLRPSSPFGWAGNEGRWHRLISGNVTPHPRPVRLFHVGYDKKA